MSTMKKFDDGYMTQLSGDGHELRGRHSVHSSCDRSLVAKAYIHDQLKKEVKAELLSVDVVQEEIAKVRKAAIAEHVNTLIMIVHMNNFDDLKKISMHASKKLQEFS